MRYPCNYEVIINYIGTCCLYSTLVVGAVVIEQVGTRCHVIMIRDLGPVICDYHRLVLIHISYHCGVLMIRFYIFLLDPGTFAHAGCQ